MLQAIKRELGRRRMEHFVPWTWSQYQMASHHRALCRFLDAIARGEIRRGMVFCPPRHGKSELVSRRFPAYFLGHHPDSEVLVASYGASLANRMNRDCQRIIDSDTYKALFPGTRLSGRSLRSGTKYARTQDFAEVVGRRGALRSAGVGGGITGTGFGLGVIDDPFKDAEQALSGTIREKVWDWYQSTFLTRQAPNARILITLTRWHHDDLAGRLLREARDGGEQWEVLSFPAISEHPASPMDPRLTAGLPLWPERFDLDWLGRMRQAVGSFWWDALYQQRPLPLGGNLFQRSWFGRFRDGGDFWLIPGREPVQKCDCQIIMAVDPAASENQSADETAIVILALTPQNDILILSAVGDRLTPDKIPHRMLDTVRQYDPAFIVFEDSGFQVAISSQARRMGGMPPIREVRTEGRGKVVRATPAIVYSESRKVFVPEPAPQWLNKFFDQLEQFRGEDEPNDLVDAYGMGVRQCPKIWTNVGKPDTNTREIAERIHRTERPSAAQVRGLWGRK